MKLSSKAMMMVTLLMWRMGLLQAGGCSLHMHSCTTAVHVFVLNRHHITLRSTPVCCIFWA